MTMENQNILFNSTLEEQQITRSVDLEILKVERLRALIFAILVLFFAALFPVMTWMNISNKEIAKRVYWSAPETLFLGLWFFEMLIWFVLGHFLKARKPVPVFCYYLAAFVEIGLLSILILMVGEVLYAYALFRPIVFMYFLIIALSGFRLNFSICVFTGSLAAIEYMVIARYLINLTELPFNSAEEDTNFKYHIHVLKGLTLFMAGLITGIVTDKLKKGFLKSYQNMSEKNKVISLFGQHVSPAVMEKLLQQKGETYGEIRSVSVMFLDIRNFTTFSESRSPQEVLAYLNSLFEFMIEIVNRNHGIINKFLGDGFMAVFGAPLSDGYDSQNAVRAAREIIQKVQEEVELGRILPTKVGIGLHTGNAVTGNVGSSQRKEYTIIGDVVNLASRIETLNKQFDSQLLISEAVRNAIGKDGEEAISLGKVTVKGRNDPVEVFKLA
jgi:adenylate cyclase